MTYTLTYGEDRIPDVETFETLDEALDRAADLAIAGALISSLEGPDGFHSGDEIDNVMYHKLDAADPNVDLIAAPREDCHAIPPPKKHSGGGHGRTAHS